ncbi:MAG: KUP/HAK/KT family potassium transporter [Rubrivivax sp.]|nr:KUP/HAK/KT family potassium transporter [Rubrivivax sp.]
MLNLGALGVCGDTGTSPFYTMKEVLNPAHGVPLDAPKNVGAVSVIFWGLMVVVIFAIMATWKRGGEFLIEQIRSDDPDVLPFITSLTEDETAHRR